MPLGERETPDLPKSPVYREPEPVKQIEIGGFTLNQLDEEMESMDQLSEAEDAAGLEDEEEPQPEQEDFVMAEPEPDFYTPRTPEAAHPPNQNVRKEIDLGDESDSLEAEFLKLDLHYLRPDSTIPSDELLL